MSKRKLTIECFFKPKVFKRVEDNSCEETSEHNTNQNKGTSECEKDTNNVLTCENVVPIINETIDSEKDSNNAISSENLILNIDENERDFCDRDTSETEINKDCNTNDIGTFTNKIISDFDKAIILRQENSTIPF